MNKMKKNTINAWASLRLDVEVRRCNQPIKNDSCHRGHAVISLYRFFLLPLFGIVCQRLGELVRPISKLLCITLMQLFHHNELVASI